MERLSNSEQKYVLVQKPADEAVEGPDNDSIKGEDIRVETSQVQEDGSVSSSLKTNDRKKRFLICTKPEVEFVTNKHEAATADLNETSKILKTTASPSPSVLFRDNKIDWRPQTASVSCQCSFSNVEVCDTRSLVLQAAKQVGKFKHSCDLLREDLKSLTEEVGLAQNALEHCISMLEAEKAQMDQLNRHQNQLAPAFTAALQASYQRQGSSVTNPDEVPSILGWPEQDPTAVSYETQENVNSNNTAANTGMALPPPLSSSSSNTLKTNPPEGPADRVDTASTISSHLKECSPVGQDISVKEYHDQPAAKNS